MSPGGLVNDNIDNKPAYPCNVGKKDWCYDGGQQFASQLFDRILPLYYDKWNSHLPSKSKNLIGPL